MKAIILVSSIFYLLGLKISNNVDFVKKTTFAPVVTNKLEAPEKSENKAYFLNEVNKDNKIIDPDSLKIKGSSNLMAPLNKEDL